jgi:hypothetical protein
MARLKNNLSGICLLLFIVVFIAGFTGKHFVFDGGTINNPNVIVAPNTTPPPITATDASGCNGTVIYQWQKSTDGKHFTGMPNANEASYKPGPMIKTTQFRRRAICPGGGTVYTNNVATIVVQ